MNLQEVTQFYARCMANNQWLKPLSAFQLEEWAWQLRDVPYREGRYIVDELYGEAVGDIEDYKFLMPRTVLKAYENIREHRKRIEDTIHSIDRQLTIEEEKSVIEWKMRKRAELVARLPDFVVDEAGIRERQLCPPPKYPPRESGGGLARISYPF